MRKPKTNLNTRKIHSYKNFLNFSSTNQVYSTPHLIYILISTRSNILYCQLSSRPLHHRKAQFFLSFHILSYKEPLFVSFPAISRPPSNETSYLHYNLFDHPSSVGSKTPHRDGNVKSPSRQIPSHHMWSNSCRSSRAFGLITQVFARTEACVYRTLYSKIKS